VSRSCHGKGETGRLETGTPCLQITAGRSAGPAADMDHAHSVGLAPPLEW